MKSRKLSQKQIDYLYSDKNINKMRDSRKKQIVSPNKGKHIWENKQHPRGFAGKKRSQEEIVRMSNRMIGEKNPMYGVRLEQNVRRMREFNPMKNPQISKRVHEKTDEIHRKKFKDEAYKLNWMRKVRAGLKKPTRPERIMIEIIKENSLPFNYVGNGKEWIRGEEQLFNPDFINKDLKCIIEVYGDYWHNIEKRKKQDVNRILTYSMQGYKTLIIWEHELKEKEIILQKVKNFINIKKIEKEKYP